RVVNAQTADTQADQFARGQCAPSVFERNDNSGQVAPAGNGVHLSDASEQRKPEQCAVSIRGSAGSYKTFEFDIQIFAVGKFARYIQSQLAGSQDGGALNGRCQLPGGIQQFTAENEKASGERHSDDKDATRQQQARKEKVEQPQQQDCGAEGLLHAEYRLHRRIAGMQIVEIVAVETQNAGQHDDAQLHSEIGHYDVGSHIGGVVPKPYLYRADQR